MTRGEYTGKKGSNKMRREEKYPNTDVYKFHNENPRGRITGDCTFRAVALATGKTWAEVVREMAEMSIESGYAINDKKGIETYMKTLGWTKCPQPRKADNTKYTGKDWCKYWRKKFGDKPCIMKIGGHHVTAIKNGKIHDIWDCSGKCVGNYWTKLD